MTKTIRRLMHYEIRTQKIQGKEHIFHHFRTIRWQLWDESLKRYMTIKDMKSIKPLMDRGWKIIEVKREAKRKGR